MRLRTVVAIAGGGLLAAYVWWRANPSPCPYGLKLWVQVPHPLITRRRLKQVLRPRAGERVLEIGPGTGYYTIDIAGWIGDEGRLDIFDIQQEMLDHTMRRASRAGRTNVVPTRGDACELPFEDASFDALVLTTVLGEIPDRGAALREAARVLRPGGRLVVGTIFAGDPHWMSPRSLRGETAAAGLRHTQTSGSPLGYFARFER